jgi:aspartate racemase
MVEDCTNTMHKVAEQVQAAVSIPLLHIADPTAQAIRAAGFQRVALLGTRFTMEQDFYRARLEQQHGLQVIVPEQSERDVVHRIIYEELCLGQIKPESKTDYLNIIRQLQTRGAQAVILGCTEIPCWCSKPIWIYLCLIQRHCMRQLQMQL